MLNILAAAAANAGEPALAAGGEPAVAARAVAEVMRALRRSESDAVTARLAADPAGSIDVIRKAARRGYLDAQVALGQCHLVGWGVARDANMAFRWFSLAAHAGSAEAANLVGRCREFGWGTTVDLAQAAACYRHAARAGFPWAQFNYAEMAFAGRGVPADRAEALVWYRRAAASGHAKAMNMLGRYHEEGWEMPADPSAAARWYRASAVAGDCRGQVNLASRLLGEGRIGEAASWLGRAVEGAHRDLLADLAATLAESPHAALRELAERARRMLDAMTELG
ncbi:tetratricopeptide repeat protein [Chelatococcus sp. GCM10030263]|uniref:tetratricopeptide repeat protein n=1 Tax=Chelatococcus sp. GCM10030263 TaxID=3273387 RepID=UPI00361D6904